MCILSEDIIKQDPPWSSFCCFGRVQATRCQAGCNIKQRALIMNGRTPATKATTKRASSDSISSLLSLLHDPGTVLEKDLSALLWTRRQSPESAQKQLSQIEHRQAEIEGGVMEEGIVHLPVNLIGVFLSWEALEERNNKHWSEGQKIKQREKAASWPKMMFRKSFTETTQQPGPNWTPLRPKSQPRRH